MVSAVAADSFVVCVSLLRNADCSDKNRAASSQPGLPAMAVSHSAAKTGRRSSRLFSVVRAGALTAGFTAAMGSEKRSYMSMPIESSGVLSTRARSLMRPLISACAAWAFQEEANVKTPCRISPRPGA